MTAISLGDAARRNRLGRTATAAAIEVGRFSRANGRYLMAQAELRAQLDVGHVASRSREFAGGFVDFLLGRGACHSR